jgi:N-succinyldiaminopimelate aminotransferase
VVFYEHEDFGRPLVRFTFCKQFDVLEEAVTRLKALQS